LSELDQLASFNCAYRAIRKVARNVHLVRMMRGVIRSSDVLKNPLVVWRGFGVRCLLRCLSAILRGHSATFLELAHGGKTE
jgi:hypothetical protein